MPVRPPSLRRSQGAFVALAFAALAFAALAFAAPGCASRAVPARFPASSAASPESREAPPANVTSALTTDPPLPGSETERWPGLRPPPHRGHHGH